MKENRIVIVGHDGTKHPFPVPKGVSVGLCVRALRAVNETGIASLDKRGLTKAEISFVLDIFEKLREGAEDAA